MRPCTEDARDALNAWLDTSAAHPMPGGQDAGRTRLVRSALAFLPALDAAPIPDAMRALTCADLTFLADPAVASAQFTPGTVRFGEWEKLVTGRRFSAGLFHWEESGIPLSWLPKVPPHDWFALARSLLAARGRRPMIVPHLNPRRGPGHMTEADVHASYRLMAEALLLQPQLRGIAGASWLRSPDTHRVSPHLACINRVILENGGFETTIGPAPADCGVLSRSATRRRLYEAGEFHPTIGLTVWPRDRAVGWWRRVGALESAVA